MEIGGGWEREGEGDGEGEGGRGGVAGEGAGCITLTRNKWPLSKDIQYTVIIFKVKLFMKNTHRNPYM